MSEKYTKKAPLVPGPNGDPVLTADVNFTTNDPLRLLDEEWVRSAFMIPSTKLFWLDRINRFWSRAQWKFYDTSPGGHIACNPRPQYTPYADIRVKGRRPNANDEITIERTDGEMGMGRFYSESLDDNAETVFLEFGILQHTNILNYLSTALDPATAFTANTGRSFGTDLGTLVGGATKIVMNPIIGSLHTLSQMAVSVIGSSSKYVKLKPTPFLYWTTVNSIVNSFAVDLGMAPFIKRGENVDQIDKELTIDKTRVQGMQRLFKDVMTDAGVIDVFALANRAQSLAYDDWKKRVDQFTNGDPANFEGYLKNETAETVVNSAGSGTNSEQGTLLGYLNAAIDFEEWFGVPKKEDNKGATDTVSDVAQGLASDDPTVVEANKKVLQDSITNNISNIEQDASVDSNGNIKEGWVKSFSTYLNATIRDGANYAAFQVDYSGTVSESFSNSTEDSALKSILHTVTDNARAIKFNLGGLSFGDGVGGAVDSIIENTAGFIAGYAGQVTYGVTNVITALLGGGYLDVPKRWSDSSVSLPKINYSMTLISPSNDPLSMLLHIYIPLAMIMAGSLPRSVGKNSYTSPFYCGLYNRGKQIVNLGIIDNLSINRGTSNLAFGSDGKALAIEVSFSVLDLSSIMSVPISGGLLSLSPNIDDDSLFYNYSATVTGRDLYSMRYFFPKVVNNFNKALSNANLLLSPARLAMLTGTSSMLSGTLGNLVFGSSVVPTKNNNPSGNAN